MANKHKCPVCKKPTQQNYKPFCSKRCADVDLGHWLGGRYAIPTNDPVSEENLATARASEQDND